MIFPGSKIWFEGKAADLEALLVEIKNSNFSGYAEIIFKDTQDIIIFAFGKVLTVLEKMGKRIITSKSVGDIWGKCKIKSGNLCVFEFPPKLAHVLKGFKNRRQFSEKSSRTGIVLKNLILDLKKKDYSGFIDTIADKGRGIIIFSDGIIKGCFYTDISGLSYSGFKGFEKIYETADVDGEYSAFYVSDFSPIEDNSAEWIDLLMDTKREIQLLSSTSEERIFQKFGRIYPENTVLFVENDLSDDVYIIQDGKVEIRKKFRETKKISFTLEKGDFFGEISLLNNKPRSMTAKTLTKCKLLVLNQSAFELMIYNDFKFRMQMIKKLALKLKETNEQVKILLTKTKYNEIIEGISKIIKQKGTGKEEGIPFTSVIDELPVVTNLPLEDIDKYLRELIDKKIVEFGNGRIFLTDQEI